MNTARTSGVLAASGRSLIDWLTGAGFLMLHATMFFVALVALIPWNLYSDPGDFWVADPLIRWAFLLAFHALVVGVWSLIRNVILTIDDGSERLPRSERSWQPARSLSRPTSVQTAGQQEATPAAAATLAEAWARQWLADSGETLSQPERLQFDLDGWGPDLDEEPGPAEWPSPPPVRDQARESIGEDPQELKPDLSELILARRTAGPLGAAARAAQPATNGEEPVDAELEWRWIEAAASAWLTRKERDSYRAHAAHGAPSELHDQHGAGL